MLWGNELPSEAYKLPGFGLSHYNLVVWVAITQTSCLALGWRVSMRLFSVLRFLVATALFGFCYGVSVQGAVYTLKNGMQIEGMPGKIASLAADPL